MRATVAGGADLQFARGVAAEHAALEIEAARRFLQRRQCARPQARRQAPVAVAGQLRQQRLHQLVEGQGGGNRVARQAAEPGVAQFAEGEGFAGFDRQLPEADWPSSSSICLV